MMISSPSTATLIWPRSKGRRKRKGSSGHDQPGTDTEGTEPRPSQEGGGPRGSAHRRGNDPAGTPPRPQVHSGSHGQGTRHRAGRRFQARKTRRSDDFHSEEDRRGHGREPVSGG